MDIESFLADASDLPPGTSQRQIHVRVAAMLNERHGDYPITAKAIEKWVTRKSIPGKWMLRVAALREYPLNPSHYA